MSDDVFAIRTSFQDVAELGQGYMERADGERMLLPLPQEVAEGEGVRFIVYLSDGTPAFAGAGRSVQVSDQGAEVPTEARYETLIDALVFDERSRPVYDYIVAVRQMAYADLGAAAEAEAEVGEEAVMESDDPSSAYVDAASFSAPKTDPAPHPLAPDDAAADADTGISIPADPADAFSDVTPESMVPMAFAQADARANRGSEFRVNDDERDVDSARAGTTRVFVREPDSEETVVAAISVSTAPLPTGMLRRPAIAAHWAPAAPKRPQPTPGSALFRYPAGPLPVPARPPRPDLDPAQRVQRAASPASN